MPIKCGNTDHWQSISLHLITKAEDFDLARFADDLGLQDPTDRWIAVDEGGDYYSRGELQKINGPTDLEGGGDAKQEPPQACVLSVQTLRNAAPEHIYDDVHRFTHERVLGALSGSARAAVFMAVSAEMAFPAGTARWRASLLANPPEMAELSDAVGSVTLSGLTLRFRDSSQGLQEARLETSDDGRNYMATLRFTEMLDRNSVPEVYEVVLSRSEDFASLFLVLEESPSTETEEA